LKWPSETCKSLLKRVSTPPPRPDRPAQTKLDSVSPPDLIQRTTREKSGLAGWTLLQQIAVEIENGKTTPQACREAQIAAQTSYHWRKGFGGLKLDQAKRLKELEKENAKLKRLVAELSLEKQVVKDVAGGNF
jgi:hypothetical protein